MSLRTTLTLASGKHIDLLHPKPEDIDFVALAEHLAKENRFNGATRGFTYSVAEHCVRGADAILTATGDKVLAGHFLLHDLPEAVLKDDTTPKKQAIAEIAETQFGVLASQILAAFDALTERHDAAIHAAAGLPWPLTSVQQRDVKFWDLTMFVTEWRDLMGFDHPHWGPYEGIEPLRECIAPAWHWSTARIDFLSHCVSLLPRLSELQAALPFLPVFNPSSLTTMIKRTTQEAG